MEYVIATLILGFFAFWVIGGIILLKGGKDNGERN